MAFLFKSKKNQDRALSSRDGNAPPPTAMAGVNARMQNEKHRATPTGSVNSLENDAVTTPERLVTSAHSRRGGSVDNNNSLGNPAGDVAVSAAIASLPHVAEPTTDNANTSPLVDSLATAQSQTKTPLCTRGRSGE